MADTALSDYAKYSAFLGSTPTMPIPSFSLLLGEVTAAIQDYCLQNLFERTYTNIIMDSPASAALVLSEGPVRNSNLTISFNSQANGNVAAFTANDVLTQYSAWTLKTDANDSGNSTSKIVLRLPQPWSQALAFPFGRLAYKWVPNPGSVLVTYTAGFSTIPASLTQATNLAISLLWQRRATGQQVASRSLDGLSTSFNGGTEAASVVQSPGVIGLLSRYTAKEKKIGWGVA